MLNIKNPEAHQLAVEVAASTGESLTDAVIIALRERRDRLKARPEPLNLREIEEITRRIRARLPQAFMDDPDPTAALYDPETGLPV